MSTKIKKMDKVEKMKGVDEVRGVKTDKYLTDIKELPPSSPNERQNIKNDEAQISKMSENTLEKNPVAVRKLERQKEIPGSGTNILPEIENPEVGGKKFPITYKEVVLGIINLASIIFIIFLLVNFPKKSDELRNLRIQEMRGNTTVGLEVSEIEAALPMAEILRELFLDEGGVVSFVGDVENQKTEGGAISKITFASQNIEKDRTGNYGYPLIIELTGSWEAIDADLQKIDALPYFFRPVKVDISYDVENPEVVIFKYGIFLYVRESLGKNR